MSWKGRKHRPEFFFFQSQMQWSDYRCEVFYFYRSNAGFSCSLTSHAKRGETSLANWLQTFAGLRPSASNNRRDHILKRDTSFDRTSAFNQQSSPAGSCKGELSLRHWRKAEIQLVLRTRRLTCDQRYSWALENRLVAASKSAPCSSVT